MYALMVLVILIVLYVVYLYLFAPIPGDTTNVRSITFRKGTPINTSVETLIAKDVKMTNTGAVSFLFVTDEIVEYADTDPIMYPILTLRKTTGTFEKGPIAMSVMYNRITSEIMIGFFNSQEDIFTVPISTSLYKEKVSIAVRLMNMQDSSSFLANVYLNGEYITSRGIPMKFAPTGGNDHTVYTGCENGVNGRIQTIRVWDDARDLTDTDFAKISADPFSI